MNYKKEILKNSEVKFIIDLTKEEWEEELNHAYEHNKHKYNVQGFRNGKTPRNLIEKTYGSTVFYDEAINQSFYKHFDEILHKEEDVEPVSHPSLEVIKLDATGLTLAVVVTIKPEVKLGDYKNLNPEKPEIKVTVAEVNAEIKNMQEKSARMVKVDRPAQLNDTVTINFVGKLNGVKFDGGSAEKFELVLGSNSFVPGFEDQLVGLKTDEEKTIEVKFPDEYPAENLKGKVTTFDVKVLEIREKVLPEINDEWAKNVSEFESLEDYKKDVKKLITSQKEQKATQELEAKLIELITDKSEVEIPEALVDSQVEEYIHSFEHNLSHQGLKLEDYLKYAKTTLEDLKKSRRDDARKTSKTRLVLEALMKKENIVVEPKELDDEIKKQAENAGISVEEFKKQLHEHDLSYILNNMLFKKLFDFLKECNNL